MATVSDSVTIPGATVGRVIGKAGTTIRRLEADHGCSVKVNPETPGSSDRVVVVKGPDNGAVAGAVDEIKRLVAAPAGPRPGRDSPRGAGGPGERRFPGGPGVRAPPAASTTISIQEGTVGKVIGPGGSTIRSLEERFHVRIRVTDGASSDQKSVSVGGDDKHSVDAAIAEIRVLATPREGGAGGARGPRAVPADHVTDSVDVPADSVGMVIGAKGATIRRLQDKFGCVVNVARGSHGDTTPVTVSGPSADAVSKTIDEILAVSAARETE